MPEPMLIAQSTEPLYLLPAMSNRHGLIAGATGTGKTVTLQVMAEALSRIGESLMLTDCKNHDSDNDAQESHVSEALRRPVGFGGPPLRSRGRRQPVAASSRRGPRGRGSSGWAGWPRAGRKAG